MSTKPKRKTALNLFDEPPPSADRLWAMLIALTSGDEIDASMRAELVSALKSIMVRPRGRRAGRYTFLAASLARALIDNRSVKSVKAATGAAFETVKEHFELKFTEIDVEAVRRAYRKIKDLTDGSLTTAKGNAVPVFLPRDFSGDSFFISNALARLQKSAKSGNK